MWCGCQKKCVFLKGRSLLWCVWTVICDWLHSGILSGFWGLNVALGIRVNQYKSIYVLISFPKLFNICFKLFLFTAKNQLNRKNNRLIFWKSTKTVLLFGFLSFLFCDSSLTFIIPSKFAKIFHKQFTAPLV